jgi:hypothetical protein
LNSIYLPQTQWFIVPGTHVVRLLCERADPATPLGAFLFMVPSIILSGCVHDLTLINPTRYFLLVVRGIFPEVQ